MKLITLHIYVHLLKEKKNAIIITSNCPAKIIISNVSAYATVWRRAQRGWQTEITERVVRVNTQAERSVLRGTPDDTWEWPFAQSYGSWSRHSLRFASQSCPLFLGSLTSLLDRHASLCPDAIQTAKHSVTQQRFLSTTSRENCLGTIFVLGVLPTSNVVFFFSL